MGRPKLNRLCSVPGCTRSHSALGYCDTHYARARKSGTAGLRAGEVADPGTQFRQVPNDRRFLAGSDGHIYSVRRAVEGVPRRMSESTTHDGYLRFAYNPVDGGRKTRHQAVAPWIASAFHGTRPEGMQVRHLDGDRTNNTPSNLRWGTPTENAADRVIHGTAPGGKPQNRKEAVSDVELSLAIDEILTGADTITAVAHRLGIRRRTLSAWLNGHHRREVVGEERINQYRSRLRRAA